MLINCKHIKHKLNMSKRFFISFTLLLLSITSFAGKEKYNARITNNSTGTNILSVGSKIVATDPQYTNFIQNSLTWPMSFKDVSVKNRVIFKVDQENKLFQAPVAACTVKVNITYKVYINGTFVTQTINNKEIVINPSANKDKLVYEFDGGNELTVDVIGFTSNGYQKLALEAEVEIERFYNFNPDLAYTGMLAHCSDQMTTKGELEIYW